MVDLSIWQTVSHNQMVYIWVNYNYHYICSNVNH